MIATGSRAWAEATMYRFYASFIETPLVAYWATGHWKYAAAIVAGELMTKVFTYRYIHKIWDHTAWGLNVSQKEKNGMFITLDLLRNGEGAGPAS